MIYFNVYSNDIFYDHNNVFIETMNKYIETMAISYVIAIKFDIININNFY